MVKLSTYGGMAAKQTGGCKTTRNHMKIYRADGGSRIRPSHFSDRSRPGSWPVSGSAPGEPRRVSPSAGPQGSPVQPAAVPQRRRRQQENWGWLIAVITAVVVALLIRAFLFEIIVVEGESMMPTLITDERIGIEKVTRYASLPQRGDIVIVRYPDMDGTYVKRTIGLPGETVEVKDSTVYIDGRALYEDYVAEEPYADMDPVVVPEDHIFVMGDNRAHSMDSRASYIGPISRDAILGHGLFVLWPFDNIHTINQDRAVSAPVINEDT